MKGERELNTRGERGVLRHDGRSFSQGGRATLVSAFHPRTYGRRREERRGVGIRLGMEAWGSAVCSGPHNLVGEGRPGVARGKGI